MFLRVMFVRKIPVFFTLQLTKSNIQKPLKFKKKKKKMFMTRLHTATVQVNKSTDKTCVTLLDSTEERGAPETCSPAEPWRCKGVAQGSTPPKILS